MNGQDEFDEAVRAARRDLPPPIDVTAAVMSTVRARQAMALAAAERGPHLAAAMAAAAALATLVPAAQAFVSLMNPMTGLIDALRTAL